MIALVAQGRREALLDSLEVQTTAAWNGQMFARQKSLSGKVLREFLPRNMMPAPELEQEVYIAKMDAWAEGANKYFAAQAPKADQ